MFLRGIILFKFKSGEGDVKAKKTAEVKESQVTEAITPQAQIREDTGKSASDATASLSSDELSKVQALRSKMISASFGEIVTLAYALTALQTL